MGFDNCLPDFFSLDSSLVLFAIPDPLFMYSLHKGNHKVNQSPSLLWDWMLIWAGRTGEVIRLRHRLLDSGDNKVKFSEQNGVKERDMKPQTTFILI